MASSYTLVESKSDPILNAVQTPVVNRFTLSIAYSLVFGLVVGLLIWGSNKIWQYLKREQRALSRGNPHKLKRNVSRF